MRLGFSPLKLDDARRRNVFICGLSKAGTTRTIIHHEVFRLKKEAQQRQIRPPQVWLVQQVKTVQTKLILVRKGSQGD